MDNEIFHNFCIESCSLFLTVPSLNVLVCQLARTHVVVDRELIDLRERTGSGHGKMSLVEIGSRTRVEPAQLDHEFAQFSSC